jgi:hypothetical protein
MVGVDSYMMSGAETDSEGTRLRNIQQASDSFTIKHLEATGIGTRPLAQSRSRRHTRVSKVSRNLYPERCRRRWTDSPALYPFSVIRIPAHIRESFGTARPLHR